MCNDVSPYLLPSQHGLSEVGNKYELISKTFLPGTLVTHHHHHQGYRKWINANNSQITSLYSLFVLGVRKAGAQKRHDVVDEKTDEYARSDDLHVRALLLVEVPGTTHPQEIPCKPYSIEDDDDHVQYLYKFTFQKMYKKWRVYNKVLIQTTVWPN